jgi:aldehyde:ferredoxin oxidoreductase/ribulose-5-phosphate 4-epimerase/fuculose-1-phosphate aldolase
MSRRLLDIDLAAGSVALRPLPAEDLAVGHGGRALAMQLLSTSPASDDALVIAPGALCGSGTPAANRGAIVFTSPLTGTICVVNEGGPFPLSLQRAGFAAMVIRGQSPTPRLLRIDGQGGQLVDGHAWWGQNADATAQALGQKGSGVLTIGPAGENGVLFAGLHAGDGNLFGRGGPGAVLGSKRLKAIVVAGDGESEVADPAAFASACADLQRLFRASPLLTGPVGFAPFGEAALIDLAARRGLLPTQNFSATFAAEATAFNGAALLATGTSSGFGCSGCPLACKRQTGDGAPLPDFFTLAAFGALLHLPDLASIHRLNADCNRLGLDPVSLAGVLAARSEIRQQPFTIEEIVALLPEIAYRRKEGALLADGAARYAAQQGRPEIAMTVHNLELAPLDPRGLRGFALAHVVDVAGQGENALTLIAEMLRKPVPVDRLSWGGKARLVHANLQAVAVFDSLGLCRHALYAAGLEEAAALAAAVSGQPCTAATLGALGARTLARERNWPTRTSFPTGMAALPTRLFTPVQGQAHPSSPPPLDQEEGETEVQRYLRLCCPAPSLPPAAGAESSALLPLLQHYVAKLVAEGIGRSGRVALLAQDDCPRAVGAAALVDNGRAILQYCGATALCLLEPPWPFADFLLRRSPQATAIVPRDSETRTFLHEIPLLRGPFDPARIAAALGSRKGILLDNGIICASGALTIEQAYVNASSLWHALYIKYLLDVLTDGFLLPEEAEVFTAFRAEALNEPSAAGLDFHPGPLVAATTIEAEMIRVGHYTVERHLVDSFFGNISCRHGDEVFISATASSLDALAGCIDPVPFDNRTTLGLVASSELAAHQGIYAQTDACTILHGHPRFSVALSMLCAAAKDCPVTDCWRDCPQVRWLNGVPIVAGEIGAGGLARRVPPVIGATGQAIVYGHGVFTIGRQNFAAPFHALVAIERWCRQEYFRRFDCGDIFG